MSAFTREVTVALGAARRAALRVRELYAAGVTVAWKGVDDPVTTADQEANALIVAELRAAFPDDGVCAEESDAAASAAAAARGGRCWFVDPLDGTRDFVDRTGEFCVMVGLAVQGRATVGVVVAPQDGTAWIGVVGEGAWREAPDGVREALRVGEPADPAAVRMVGSRSHAHPRVAAVARHLGGASLRPVGSVGLKVAAVVDGAGDLYVHCGSGMKLWDGCAPEAIARGAGATVTDCSGHPLAYGTDRLALPDGIVVGAPAVHAAALAALRLAP